MGQMPDFMKKVVRRRGNADEAAPPQPVSQISLFIPEQYARQCTSSPEQAGGHTVEFPKRPQFSPDSISLDFEKAANNAARAVFHGAEVSGCFFHLMRNTKKYLSLIDLLPRSHRDGELALAARMCIAIAFLPEDHVERMFEEMVKEASRDLFPVLGWFEQNYIS
uniref:MULE transposase domain-containing protein n=1 Tax=Trichuris muris TaxID=70415 RepID=A0A5S6Q8Y9_TRIMR